LHGANDHFFHLNRESVLSDFFLPEIHLPLTSITAFCVKTISKNAVALFVLIVLTQKAVMLVSGRCISGRKKSERTDSRLR
jgi:hypothetical protein